MKRYRKIRPPAPPRAGRTAHSRTGYQDLYEFIVSSGVRVGIDPAIVERFARTFVAEKCKRQDDVETV